MASKSKIVQFPNAAKLYGTDKDIVAEVLTIKPTDATSWLKCNKNNRPIRKNHVAFLAREILLGNWQLNGQAIVIAEDEQVLDGQHRLFAIIEAGKPIQSLVVYGISPEAFKTMDTGAVRTGADALSLHFPSAGREIIKAAATAVQWCGKMERGNYQSTGGKEKISNTDIIEYTKNHPSLFTLGEVLCGYPRDARPISLGAGVALYEMFNRKHQDNAEKFMRRFFTGEDLARTDVEYLLRAAFIKDAERTAKYSMSHRMRMVVKGWNWLRRGNTSATRNVITVSPNDDPKLKIF